MGTYFHSIPETTKVIFICDNAQLASISCGNIVEDIINADIIPTTKLNKIFRYGSSGIATVATNTRNGDFSGRQNNNFQDNDYKYVDIDKQPLEQIVEEYNNLLLNGYKKNDILILCPYNKSNLGTYTINEAIQKKFNSNPNKIIYPVKNRPVKQIEFHVGDKVINTKNNYKSIVADIDEGGEYYISNTTYPIMNGDIGIIRSIDCDDSGKFTMYIQFDEKIICFDNKTTANLLLGYAISVHKSQGTQAKAVISVIGKNHSRMVTRNLLYVAATRTQEKLIEIMDKEAVENGLNKVETIDRSTWLNELIKSSNAKN